ncbi:hypothetical protein H4R20_002444 [Coemansia guatemalensis]|uniref:P-loop containing nucleoside triphosphate hydrolase protein n=1 Tax=Coemansia guatemalensis TaxID=2761395 RepID=A0A9W8HVG3_9FUNG|nr:hypothetical protein H4R20_002444 [Coemansia guatemalensis]
MWLFQCPSGEGWGPLSPTHPSHLTTCFQHGPLVLFLNTIFLVTAAVRLRRNKGMPPLPSALVAGRLFWSKMLCSTAAVLVSAVELIAMASLFPYLCVYTLSLGLQTAAVAIAVYLHLSEQFHNRIASTPLLLFWLQSTILSLMRLRTAISTDYANDFNSLVTPIGLFTTAALAAFVLECLPKPRALFKQTSAADDGTGFGSLEDSDSDYSTSGSPEERANFFSRSTYAWVGSLLAKGYRSQLQIEDIWKMDGQYRPDVVNARFQRNWQAELASDNPSLFRATARTYWKIWALAAMYKLLRIVMTFLRPIILSRLIQFAGTYGTQHGSPIEHGYFYAVVLFLVSCGMNIVNRQRWTHARQIERLVKTSYMTAIYQKALAMSSDTRQKYDVGSIVTHMSVDTEIITFFIEVASQNMWCEPLQIVIAMFMLYRLLGWSTLAGVFVMLACMPPMSRYGKMIGTRSKLLMSYRDRRMGIMNEILAGIRVVKMYAWESSFIKRINDVRIKLELDIIRRNNMLKSVLLSIATLISFMVDFATFGIYSIYDNVSHGPLSAQLVFVGMPLLNVVGDSLRLTPQTIPEVTRAIASFNRIYRFLAANEIDMTSVERLPYDRALSGSADAHEALLVSIDNGSFGWSLAGVPALRDINFKCRRDELVAVIGQVGSGKSSLVSAILGDMVKRNGHVAVRGNVAYVPQQPWILNATLRDNILFGSDFDQDFYELVIDACALRQDIVSLSAGDMTEIGERGINLSGGQKMRVSLARAIYARADVYILDDPLAAVDAHVSKHIFTHVLGPQGMLQSRARILVTNAVQYLNSVDNIVMLRDGRIIEQGSFTQAMDIRGRIFTFVRHHADENQGLPESSSTASDASDARSKPNKNYRAVHEEVSRQELAEPAEDEGKIIKTEHRREGEVEWKTYYSYAKAGGLYNVLTAIFAYAVALLGEVCSKLWLRHWTSSNSRAAHDIMPSSAKPVLYYLSVYCALGLLITLASMVQMIFMRSRCSTRASTIVHQNMLTGVIRSPTSFFDSTPTGRILNRFSSDMQRCDEVLPDNVSLLLGCIFQVILAIVLVGISTPQILIATPLLALIGLRCQRLYLRSAREIRRLESTTGSSIYAFFQETVSGVSIIRAHRQQSRFIAELERRIGQHIRINNSYVLINQWLAMRLEVIGSIMILGVTVLTVAAIQKAGFGSADTMGLAAGAALTLGFKLTWFVRAYSELEISMTHLERIIEYGELMPEAADIVEDHRPEEPWPEQGLIEFRNYSMRYREGLDLVLKDLSFRVLPRQKVGIVGRTGAGKSSLTLALFRIIESASGQILLDGKDIAQYGLFDVRSKLSIIPQEPVLFAGTVRENLDPFNSYNDQDIWKALEQTHLADYIRSKDERLEFMVTQSGENFSIGQRQLICLARALLKHSKVLVLDEATAAIDNTTDKIIQQTIRTEFKDCTVLTIAHRLDTVIDSDMILVIDAGQLAEYDTPKNLIANKDSIFTKLVEEAERSL